MFNRRTDTYWQGMKRFVCILMPIIILIGYTALSPLRAESRPRVSWKRVPGASAYIVTIKNNQGNIIFSKRTTDSFIEIDIAPGSYRIRITVLNKFQKPASSTKWERLIVKRSFKPQIDSISPNEIYIEDNSTTLAIDGSRFAPECTITLKMGTTTIIPLSTNRVSSELLSFTIDPKKMPVGRYSVIITNPGGEQYTYSEGLLLKTRKKEIVKQEEKALRVDDYLPSTLYKGNADLTLQVFGEGFTENSTLFLQQTVNSIRLDTTFISSQELRAKFNPANQATGTYDLVVSDDKKGRITKQNALVLKDKTEGIFALHGLRLGLGISGNVLLPKWSSEFKSSFKGVHCNAGYDLKNFSGISTIAFLNQLSLEAEIDYISFERKDRTINYNRVTGSLSVFSYGANLVYTEPFSNGYQLLFRLGGGMSYSRLELLDESAETTEHSNDFYLETGPAFRYLFADTVFFETGVSYKHIFYKTEALNSMRSFFRIGVRL